MLFPLEEETTKPFFSFPEARFRANNLASVHRLVAIHNKLHPARFAGSVLYRAVLSEMSPLPALARHLQRTIAAHAADREGDPGSCLKRIGTQIRLI
jgi:hypothetical protein